MLALPAPQSDDDKVSEVICGICLVQVRNPKEIAGRSFHAEFEKPRIDAKRKGKGAPGKDGSDDEKEPKESASWKKKKRKEGGEKASGSLKLSHLLEGVDLYKLLEVSEGATNDQVKKQYRKMALQHHPDKQHDTVPEADSKNDHHYSSKWLAAIPGVGAALSHWLEAAPKKGGKSDTGLNDKEMHFIKIQEAYEVLSDDTKRRQYDSTLSFDDAVPEVVKEKIGFYATFGPVFQRNARFSCREPVPDLGDETTDIAKVHKFMDFWYNFESWRDFSMHDEYNIDDAEFREEKRWMERQNQKIRKGYQNAEHRRIMRLVENAERLDPRLQAEREELAAKKREEREKRARAKQDEQEAQRRVVEEKKEKLEREKAEQEEKERLEREEKKQKTQVARTLRQRAKKAMQQRCKFEAMEWEELQEYCLALDVEALEGLCLRMEKLPAKQKEAEAAVRAELAAWKKKKVADQEEQAKQKEEARQREKQKAEEAKANNAASGPVWSAEEMGFLAKGLKKFPGGVGGRWSVIAQFISSNGYPRTEKEVIEKTKEMSDGQSLRSMGSQLSSELTSFKSPKAAAPAAAPPKAAAAPKANATAAAKAEPKAAASSEAATAEWSAEQQKALEVALQKHPASLDKNERWRLIAEDVPGKSKSQCVERFKFLREQLAKQKK